MKEFEQKIPPETHVDKWDTLMDNNLDFLGIVHSIDDWTIEDIEELRFLVDVELRERDLQNER